MTKDPAYGIFYEYLVCNLFHKYYLRTNLSPSSRPIMRVSEIERYLYTHAAIMKIEKLRRKGVAMYAYEASVYYACTCIQLLFSIRDLN